MFLRVLQLSAALIGIGFVSHALAPQQGGCSISSANRCDESRLQFAPFSPTSKPRGIAATCELS